MSTHITHMTKNMTLTIPDEIIEKMNKLTEVNWSAVARDAIEKYIEARKEPEIAPILERLTEEKNKQYAKGFSTATKIAKGLLYETFAVLFSFYDGLVADELAIKYPPTTSLITELSRTKTLSEPKKHELMIETFQRKGHLPTRLPTTKQFKVGFYEGMMKFKEIVSEE